MIAFPLGGVPRVPSASADAASCAIGRSSIGPTRATRRITRSPRSGRRPAASRWRACSKSRLLPPYEGASGLGLQQRAGPSRLAVGDVHRRVPAGAHRLPRPRAAGAGLARSVHARSSRTSRTIRAAGRHPALSRDESRRGAAKVSIAWSIENPLRRAAARTTRVNEHRAQPAARRAADAQPAARRRRSADGQLRALRCSERGNGRVTQLRGWPRAAGGTRRCTSGTTSRPTARSGPSRRARNPVGALCLQRTIAPGAQADFTFLLAWHFPNRTPDRCGWSAPKGDEDTRHRQPLLHALRRRLGGGRVRRDEPGAAREADAALRRGAAREHAARPR